MEVKTEITKLWTDLQASAREFASLGLATSGKALEAARSHLTRLEETLKRQAEKLNTKKDEAEAAKQ
jgi:hypothetical protein